MTASAERVDRASRLIAAPPARVYAALVTVTAEQVPVGVSPEDHAKGLASSLANLAAYVEGDGAN